MGQRLKIEIVGGGNVIANAYYHWSAYTKTAVGLTMTILREIENMEVNNGNESEYALNLLHATGADDNNSNEIEYAVKLLHSTGAGVNKEELTRIDYEPSTKYHGIEFNYCINRNTGLLSVTPEGIKETQDAAASTVIINLDTKTVDFWVYSVMDPSEYDDIAMDKVPTIKDIDFRKIRFSDFYKIQELINMYPYIRLNDNTIIEWIE